MSVMKLEALDRVHKALAAELETTDQEIEKYLQIAYDVMALLNKTQKRTENDIAKEAETNARKANVQVIGTYWGRTFSYIPYGLGAVEIGFDMFKYETLSKAIGLVRNANSNYLEAERTKYRADKDSLDMQNQQMKGSANQHDQEALEQQRIVDQIGQNKLRTTQAMTT